MLSVRVLLIALACIISIGCNSKKPTPVPVAATPSLADQLAGAKELADHESARCTEIEERLAEVMAIKAREVELGSDQAALDRTDALIKKITGQLTEARLERAEALRKVRSISRQLLAD